MSRSFSALILLTLCLGNVQGQNAKTAFLDGDAAGMDFDLQGEYSGTVKSNDGEWKLGVQVIAEGHGKFRSVGYIGGLPGDGWDQSREKIPAAGEVEGDKLVLRTDRGRAEVKGGNMTIYTQENVRIVELPKVMRTSPTLGRKPPPGAVVLFDGTSADNFINGRMSDDGLLMEGVTSKQKFGSYNLHLEFLLSFMPHARGQGRANSGCYQQGRYEVQILDSFGLDGKNNECGGVYEIRDPSVNMCFPPLSWQTYDIEYHQAVFDDTGNKTENAWMTVRHNGVTIHDKLQLPRGTRAAPVKEGPEPGPIYLQNHGNPIRFRNIWLTTIP